MEYKDIVNEANDGQVFLCELEDGSAIAMQVHDNCESATEAKYVLYNFEDVDDLHEYTEEDIKSILEHIHKTFDDEHEPTNIDVEGLKKFLMQDDVYKFSNKEELKTIYNLLQKPIISGAGWDEEDKYLDDVKENFGIVFYWSEYDDFSCYGDGFTHYVKIITGVK